MKKFGLVLGSSGSRGSSYIGFIKALEEANLTPDYITGCSMGSIVGACYAYGMSSAQMEKEIYSLKFSQLVDLSVDPVKNAAFLRSNKLTKKIDCYFEGVRFCDLKIPFKAVATDIITGAVYTFEGEELLTEGIVASCTIPSIFKPIKKNDMLLVDGGVKCRLPISQVRNMGAEVVVAVDALGKLRRVDKAYNIATLMLRTFDVMDAEINKYRLKELKPDLVLEPDLGEMSQYKFKNFEQAIEAGYKIGKQNINKILALLNE